MRKQETPIVLYITDDYAKYKVIYMNNKSYCIHISKKVEADK